LGWERREFFVRKGLNWEQVKERIGEVEEGVRWYGEWEKEERERQREIRREKISSARYNRWYKEVKGKGVPGYLKRGWGEERWSRIARFRLGNVMEERKYWEETGKKMCRLCGGELESWGAPYGRDAGNGEREVEEVGRRQQPGCWGRRGRGKHG